MQRSVAILFALSIWASAAVAGRFEDGVAAYERKDYATAFALLKPFADQGDASAQAGVGVMYANGWGVPKNEQQAAVWCWRRPKTEPLMRVVPTQN